MIATLKSIRAELTGAEQCSAEGIVVSGHAPVLMLCRKLLSAGYDPTTPVEVYRGQTLALKVRSIGEAAKLSIDETQMRFQTYPDRLRQA